MKRNRIAFVLTLVLCLVLLCAPAHAADPTDEILNYAITASVNDDGTVNLDYHIDWKVLRDDIGALEWITVGIPNGEYVSIDARSDTIRSIRYSSDNGSSVRIDFDRSYHAGETVSFDFSVVQDYLYHVDLFQDNMTSYVFTPGWFDEIAVDALTVRWAAADATSWSPDCLVKDGYLTWTTVLAPGETFSVRVNYPDDARQFNTDKTILQPGERSGGGSDELDNDTGDIIAGIVFLALIIGVPVWLAKKAKKHYSRSASFGGETKTKITRTKVTYYPVCQGCGAPRGEGETVCSHCGRSYVKSEEVIKEENVPEADKEALKYKTKGEYRYSSAPDTYVRVNVVNIPVVHHHSSYSSSRSSGSSGSSRSSGGCAHSSCACACASCACACACACAGGGRAGCTYKDFYRTDLKLRQLKLRRR